MPRKPQPPPEICLAECEMGTNDTRILVDDLTKGSDGLGIVTPDQLSLRVSRACEQVYLAFRIGKWTITEVGGGIADIAESTEAFSCFPR